MNRAITLKLLRAAGVFAVVAGLAIAAGVRVNTSASLPLGVYWQTGMPAGQDAASMKGAWAAICPPPGAVFAEARRRGYVGPGFCPGGYGYVMKKVAAVHGDRVSVTNQGVSVNGVPIPNSKPFEADKAGRPLPLYRAGQHTLGASEVLLMSDHNIWSFDARYFGPLDRSQIRGFIRPVWTW